MNHPLHLFAFCPCCGSSQFVVNNEKSKRCEHCGFVYYFNSSAAVVALIFNEKGDLLVTRRAKEPAMGTLDLPGGFIDLHETAEQAVCREIKEELGLELIKTDFLFSLPNVYPYSGFEVHTLDMFFACTAKTLDGLTACDDVSESFFVPKEQLCLSNFGLTSIRNGLELLIKKQFKL